MLYSGGADSLALWYMTGKPIGVYVSIGAKYEAKELEAIAAQQAVLPELRVTVVEGPRIGILEQHGGRIPVRNSLLIATAIAYTNASKVVVGFLRGETSSDKSSKFIEALSHALSVSESRHIDVWAPAIAMTKTELLAWLMLNYPEAPLHLTVSCYSADGKPCGDCQSCFRGDVAKYLSGWSDDLPRIATNRGGIWSSLRMAGVRRWPEVLANNYDAWKALRGKR